MKADAITWDADPNSPLMIGGGLWSEPHCHALAVVLIHPDTQEESRRVPTWGKHTAADLIAKAVALGWRVRIDYLHARHVN